MTNKLKIKEPSFQITANIDERIKTTKHKLLVKSPNEITIKPKSDGIIINQVRDVDVHKQDIGCGIVLKKTDQTVVYKQIKVIDIFSPDYVPSGITWGSDWDQYDPNDPDTPQLVYSVGERVNSTTPQISGINTPIQLEISWNNYDSKLGITHDTIIPDAEWTVSVNSSASYGGSITDLNDSPVNITVSNGQYIIFSLYSDATINEPQIRTYTIKNKSIGNTVLDEFTMGAYAYLSLL